MSKKNPQRMCVGCREMKSKPELVRVVRSPDGDVSLDADGKKPGRGAYVCRSITCLNRAIKSKALSRAFGTPIPEHLTDALHLQMEIPDGSNS